VLARPNQTLVRRISFLILATASLSGCRPPAEAPFAGGTANLDELMRAHPSWPQVAALDARIQALAGAAPSATPIALPSQRAVALAADVPAASDPALDQAQRRELQRLIGLRVERDYEALAERLEEEVVRYEAAQRAAALARAEADIAARGEQFRVQWWNTVQQYAEVLGPLLLLRVALMPGLGDTMFYPPPTLEERVHRRGTTTAEIGREQAQMDAALRGLEGDYLHDVAARRQAAIVEAQNAAGEYRQARLEGLRSSRERQRQRLQADLERALREARRTRGTPVPPSESLSQERSEMARRVLEANDRARLAAREAAARNVAALATLRREREQLVAMIRGSTEALALAVGQHERLRIDWTEGRGDPRLTDRLRTLLRERWAAKRGGG
jgi:hypothetical protein